MKQIKPLLLLLMLLFGSTAAFSQIQQIKIVSFNVKNQLPGAVDSWGSVPGSVLLVAQMLPNQRVKGITLMVQIRSGGSIVCSNNTTGGMQVDEFTTRTFSANELTGALAGCQELKDGSYSICVQFFNVDRVAISNEMCKEFTVETPKATDFAPPTLITPENKKTFTEAELQRPVIFRWTPLVPRPKEAVTYKLRVWQLMQGQTGTQAIRTSQPIITKDVDNITQAVVTGILTGPCKPPYLCDFVWNVQAVNREGKPIGRNDGTSEPYTFKVQNNIDTEIDSLKVGCCENGLQSIYIRIKNNLATAVNITAINYKINGIGAAILLTPVTPPPTQTIPGNGSMVFTASIKCIDNLNTLKIITDAVDPVDSDVKETEVATDTLHCRCDVCDEKNFSLKAPPPGNINIINNTISFNQAISITAPGKTVTGVTADLVYFEMVPENDLCIPCNKDAAAYGHFSNGTNTFELPKPLPQQVNLSITTPQLTPCCSALFRWCIRYKVELKDSKGECFVCHVLVCYEKKKEGCEKTTGGINNPTNPTK